MAIVRTPRAHRAYANQNTVAGSGWEDRSPRVRHSAFIAGELVLLALAVALAVVVRGHPAPLPGDVGGALDLQRLVLPHRALTQVIDGMCTLVGLPAPNVVAATK